MFYSNKLLQRNLEGKLIAVIEVGNYSYLKSEKGAQLRRNLHLVTIPDDSFTFSYIYNATKKGEKEIHHDSE